MRNISFKITVMLSCIISLNACNDFIQVDPPSNQLINSTVFENDVTAVAGISGLYARMISSATIASGSLNSMNFIGSLSADELTLDNSDPSLRQFYESAIHPTNSLLTAFWDECYVHINFANSIIEGLEKSTNVTPTLRLQLMGEAKFVRAFAHFYLVNLFGEVPIIKTTDYTINAVARRMPVVDVYEFIVTELLEAKQLLAADYSNSNSEKTRPNKYVAAALLARVYLYIHDWANAEAQASEVIGNVSAFGLETDLNRVFLKNSSEAIWQLAPVNNNYTNEGNLFLRNSTAVYSRIKNELLDSFEPNDQRKSKWTLLKTISGVSRIVPYKYKSFNPAATLNEYSMVLRLAEQFLIRAEARAQQDNLTGPNSAESDLNSVRIRAGLGPTTATTKEELLTAILSENRFEFFVEWGHRWLDLKRTGTADEVLSVVKPSWDSFDKFYPIPDSETLTNPNMRQNDGY